MMSSPDLIKPTFKETATIQLTAPILRIGSETPELTPFEYVVTSDRVYFPNQEVLARLLLQRRLLDDYVETIKWRESLVPLLQTAFGDEWLSIDDQSGDPLFSKAIAPRNWTDRQIENLRPMIRDKFDQLYIPGSSIKGAIRTAVAYHLLKYPKEYRVPEPQKVSAIEQQLQKSMGSLKRDRKKIGDRQFMQEFFTNNHLTYKERSPKTRQGPNTDFMRAIQVSDSTPLLRQEVSQKGRTLIRNQAIVAEVMVVSHFANRNAKYRASIFAECVFNANATFQLSLDSDMLSWFQHQSGMKLPFQSIKELLGICQEFAQDQWDEDYNYWQDIRNHRDQERSLDLDLVRQRYEKEICPYSLRVGWGSGMNGTTVSLQLPETLRQEIRDNCGIQAPRFQAPKTRRIVVDANGELKYPLGWVKLKAN